MDVSGLEPWAEVMCAACEETVRVRRSFHHFSIVREVGVGGMSRVFGARDESLGRDLALKILNPGLSQDDKRLRQFEREAQITASISHPNVVKVYTAGRDQDYFYIAMELVEGGSLDDRIRKSGRLPEAWVLELAEQVVQGLKAAEEAGLIHRDIKPGNILLSAEGTPKIVDFGLAVFTRDGVDDAEIWATPYYVPPETLNGEPEDFRSDVYALGSSLYHALMGKPLFDSDSNSLSELKALKSKPADLREAATVVSQETLAMLTRTLRRKPADRYISYDEFLDHLRYARRRLRRGGRGAPWPGRQSPGPAHWAGITAAVLAAGFGVWKMVDSSSSKNAQDSGGLLTDTDPSLGTDSTVSSKFLAARETLYRGEFNAARQQFLALASDASVRQPTLNWALYNAGLAALLTGDLSNARADFSVIRQAGLFSGTGADAASARFFVSSASAVDSDEAVPAYHAADCPPDSAQAIGLLSAGLKNWHLGDLSGAITFLKAFEASTPPRSAAWVDRYKKLAQAFFDDVKIIDALPVLPLPPDTTPEAATALLNRARTQIANLTLPGAARNAAEIRLRDLETAVNALQEDQSMALARKQEALAAKELEELARVESEAAPFGRSLAFSDGAAKIRDLKPVSLRGKETVADALRWWENADSFLDVLNHDLSAPMEAVIERRSGPPIKGLVGGTLDGLKVKPPNSPETSLPFTICSPACLAALAERVMDRIADSDEYYRRRELLVAFALRSGLETYATVTGRDLAREHPGFRVRWAKLGALP